MFFKKENSKDKSDENIKDNRDNEILLNKGAFAVVPNEAVNLILFFLDVPSLNRFAMTNSSFTKLVYQLPGQIHIQLMGKKYSGTYLEVGEKIIAAKNAEAQQKHDEASAQIAAERLIIKEQRRQIKRAWQTTTKDPLITSDEKLAVGCGLFWGTVGGIVVSFLAPWSCIGTTALGMAIGGGTPLVVSRTIKCCCGMCVDCREQSLNDREESLNRDDPTLSAPTM